MTARLDAAIAEGLSLPGPVLAMRPAGDADLSALDGVAALATFRPDHDRLAARMPVVTEMPGAAEGAFASAIVFAQRSRALTRAMLHDAARMLPPGAPIWLDGAKTDGVEAALRAVRAWAPVDAVVSKAHGKLAVLRAAAPPADWAAAPMEVDGMETVPGVFSEGKVDPGSRALAAALPPLKGVVCDLGAGWGWLSARVLASPDVASLDLVEAEALALDCARRNVADPRATFRWEDATAWEGRYDAVVCNPPFHAAGAGRAADPALGQAFLAAAAGMLAPGGRLVAVANRHLPYEAALRTRFAEVVALREGGGYKVLDARRPLRGRADRQREGARGRSR